MRFRRLMCLAAGGTLLATNSLPGASLLSPGDTIYAIDLDYGTAPTSPAAEGVANVLDGNPTTKYLNTGHNWSGFIVTPGDSTVQSIRLTTANDATGRDPSYFQLFGTKNPISSSAQGRGLSEDWTLISSGSLSLPSTRLDSSTVVSFGNSSSYTSYKLVFPNTKQTPASARMQIADVQFYSGLEGGGSALLHSGLSDTILPIDQTGADNSSRYPGAESPTNLLDDNPATKYLNFGGKNSGFIVAPTVGPTIIDGFEYWTANDQEGRDPSLFAIFGRRGSVPYSDNLTLDDLSGWAPIAEASVLAPTNRFAASGLVSIANTEAYDAYLVVVKDTRNPTSTMMQLGDFQLYGTVVPEPSIYGLLGLGLMSFVFWRRRRS